ncbi:hypothetical protein BGZ49_008382 [Haplosporangium sp. Z 27]|nr:hypothetical protein BGZ49_008382 [Haplosporangium sp. Z 27]
MSELSSTLEPTISLEVPSSIIPCEEPSLKPPNYQNQEKLAKIQEYFGRLVRERTAQQQRQLKKPVFYDEVDSPLRKLLREKIEYIKKMLFRFERHPNNNALPEVPDANDPVTDEIYVVWCSIMSYATPTVSQYKRELFRLLEKLQEKEEEERKVLRNKHRHVYENDESPHRKHLNDKIAIIKNAIKEFHDQNSGIRKQTLPDLPVSSDEMDIDVFMIWCLQSKEYQDCRRMERYDSCQWPFFQNSISESGCLIEKFLQRDEEERKYLVQMRESIVNS